MDASSYRRSAAARASDTAAVEDELAWNGLVTYDHCESLSFVCPGPGCENIINIRRAVENHESSVRLSLETCEKCNVGKNVWGGNIGALFCLHPQPTQHRIERLCCKASYGSFQNTVVLTTVYQFDYRCDDPVCEFSTRTHFLRWSREGLECPKCSGGVLRKEYSAKDLFDQQMFWKQVVDVHKAIKELKPEQQRILQTKPSFPSVISLYNELLALITEYIDKNAYSKVDLAFLFAPMLKIE
ncbi:hypothetical protein OSTOST_20177 [Ostertagia ostertagi]